MPTTSRWVVPGAMASARGRCCSPGPMATACACENCDNCAAGRVAPLEEGPFAIGQGVDHSEWGRGTVQQFEPGRVVVLFDHAGYPTLSLDLVEENNLLRPAS